MSEKIRKICVASLRANWLLCLFVLLFFALGGICGVLAVDYLKPDQVKEISNYLNAFIEYAASMELNASNLKSNIVSNLLIILVLYLAGLTVLGIPAVMAVVFARGFTFGFAVGFLLKHQAWQGLVLSLVSIMPQNVLYLPALLIAAVSSLSFSILLVKRYFDSKIAVLPGFIGYNLLFLMMTLITIAGGLVEIYLTPLLVQSTAAVFAG